MLLFFITEPYAPWLIPYVTAVIFIGFLYFVLSLLEFWYASIFSKPLFRYFFIYKKLSQSQLSILNNEFSFYRKLSERHKRQFEHRVAHFISRKEFIGRENLVISERMIVLISAIACMLSFGRKNYTYALINFVLIYPEEFFSTINKNYHKGEFNPREKAIVFSWKDFEEGFKISNDNLNVGIHEFMHAMQLEAKRGRDIDSMRFSRQFKIILTQLSLKDVQRKIHITDFFRAYAFTNQYEFMAVLAEYFFESPKDFKNNFPVIYNHTKKLLNFNFADF